MGAVRVIPNIKENQSDQNSDLEETIKLCRAEEKCRGGLL